VCMSTSPKSDTFGNSNEIEQTSSCALEPPSAKVDVRRGKNVVQSKGNTISSQEKLS
jgi:hypothetical protein